MSSVTFDWDPRKDATNKRKHGVTFHEAKSVFTDDYARLIADPEHSDEEDRFIILGMSISSRLLVVCHCISNGDTIRIISARKADKRERQVYEGFRHA